jgi:hypothetical protein
MLVAGEGHRFFFRSYAYDRKTSDWKCFGGRFNADLDKSLQNCLLRGFSKRIVVRHVVGFP